MKIVIKTTNGVSIMTLVNDADEAEAIEKWKLVNPEQYVSHRQMPDSAIPVDRTYRSAWVLSPDKQSVVVDSSKIAPPAPTPTKEELLAQLNALSAQIQALE